MGRSCCWELGKSSPRSVVVKGRGAHQVSSQMARGYGQLSGRSADIWERKGAVLGGVVDKENFKSYSLEAVVGESGSAQVKAVKRI
jgi:hypothetical protein